jgi:hypothetical protein
MTSETVESTTTDVQPAGYASSVFNLISKLATSLAPVTSHSDQKARVVNANVHETDVYSWMEQCAIRWLEVTGRVYESKFQPSVALAFYKVYVFNGGNMDPVHMQTLHKSTTSSGVTPGVIGDVNDPRYTNILKTDRTMFSNIVVSTIDVYSKLVLRSNTNENDTLVTSGATKSKSNKIQKINSRRR